MAISLRPMESTDFAYVKSTTREILLKQSAYFKGLHPATVDAILDPILAAYNTTMAVDSNDPSESVGFVVYRDAYDVAFVYVRSQFRSKPRCTAIDVIGTRCRLALGHNGPDVFDPENESGRDRVGGGVGRAMLNRVGIALVPEEPEGGYSRPAKYMTEIACPLMVTNLAGQNFPRMAERRGYRLRFRPFISLELQAEVSYGRKNRE